MAAGKERLRLSVLSLFRAPSTAGSPGGAEVMMRTEITDDLSNLLGTVQLGAAIDLTDFPYVRKSVLNYGMPDLMRLTLSDLSSSQVQRDLRETIELYEPRLDPKRLVIQAREDAADGRQHVSFDIRSEMRAEPVDVSVSFSARIDPGAGKVALAGLRVGG